MLRIFVIVMAIMLSPIAANAEIPAPKIAVVDINKIMSESKAAKSLKSQMEAKGKEFKAQVEAQDKKLNAAKDDLIKQKSVLSKEALEQKQKQFVTDLDKARKDVAEKDAKLQNAYRGSLNSIQESVQAIIDKMAAEQGFNVAIPTSQLIYANKTMDITAEVLKRLDAKTPTVALKL